MTKRKEEASVMAPKKGLLAHPLTVHLIAILIFLTACTIYFYPQLQGKVISQSDIVNWEGASKEALDYKKATGQETLWTNSMFGGMPTYQICADTNSKNWLTHINALFMGFFNAPIGLFLLAMIATYLALVLLGINSWVAMIAGLCFAFSPYTMILFEAGHNTKINAIALTGLVISGVILTYRGNYLKGGLLFTLGMGLSLLANHVQMTYYLGITIGLFVFIQLYFSVRDGKIKHFMIGSIVLGLGLFFAIMTSSLNLFMTYDYAKDTIRGDDIITKSTEGKSVGEVKGLDWQYATDWSHSPLELLTVVVPGIMGGSSAEKVSSKSGFAQFLSKQGYGNRSGAQAPLYWGDLPFTSGPVYFGVIPLLLFILGAIMVRGSIKWWLVMALLLTMILSLGRNAEWFTRLWFDYFPMYSKFRAPNSIMTISSIFAIFLGAIFLDQLLKGSYDHSKLTKAMKIGGGGLAIVTLFLALLGPALFDFIGPGDGRYAEMGLDSVLIEDRKSLLRMDGFKGFLFVMGGLGLIWGYINGKVSKGILVLGIALLGVMDLWIVGKKYLDTSTFVSKREAKANTEPRSVDLEIMQDKDPNFRVLDYSINTFNSAQSSYFHKTIGGYHAAKLRRIQDLIEHYFTGENFDLVVPSLMNTKYFIMPGLKEGEGPLVKYNKDACGNAWFVRNIKIVENANQELDAIGKINPKADAIIHKEFASYTSAIHPQDSGTIRLDSYAPNRLIYSTNSNSDQLAVFSEVWYPKGWHAYLDGNPVEHIRADYILRALKVPAGAHKVEFRFESDSYKSFGTVTMISSILLILAILGAVIFSLQQKAKGMSLPHWF